VTGRLTREQWGDHHGTKGMKDSLVHLKKTVSKKERSETADKTEDFVGGGLVKFLVKEYNTALPKSHIRRGAVDVPGKRG